MIKKWEDSIRSMSRKQIDLVFSIFDERTISTEMRYALYWLHESGRSITSVSCAFDVDRAALSKAENKVVGAFSKINAYFSDK